MDAGIERIHELLDKLADAVKETFPDYSRISTICADDGYRSFTILKWGDGETPETTPRRELFDQTKCGGYDWDEDRSSTQNQYYEKCGVLLKE